MRSWTAAHSSRSRSTYDFGVSPVALLEQLVEVVLRQADVTGECVERQVLIQVRLNVHQRGNDPGQRRHRFLPKNRQERVRADDYASSHDTRSRGCADRPGSRCDGGQRRRQHPLHGRLQLRDRPRSREGLLRGPRHRSPRHTAALSRASPSCSWLAGGWACGPPFSSGWSTPSLTFAVLAASGLTLRIGAFFAVSLLTQLVSAYLGALSILRSPES